MHSDHKVQSPEKWGDGSVSTITCQSAKLQNPALPVCLHARNDAQTVKQSSTKFGIQEIP